MARNGDEYEPLLATSDRQIYCASNTCCANGSGSYIEGLHFYRFPKDARRCRQWIENCGNHALSEKPVTELYQNTYLCRAHFDATQFEMRDGSRCLKPHAVPTIFTPVNFQHLEMDHDYLSVLPRVVQQPSKMKLPTLLTVVPREVTSNEGSQAALRISGAGSEPIEITTSNNSTELPGTNDASTTELSPTAVTQTKPRAAVAAAPQKVSSGAPHRRQQAAHMQRKQPSVLVRRIAPSAKETPLQKYMLLCAEFKTELKLAEKRKETLERLFTGVQELLFQEAELLNTEDTAILVGSLVKFQQERYCRRPDNLAEKVLCSLWSKYQKKQPQKVQQRPFAQVAVFVMAESQPGRVILGRRKSILGGGLYQVDKEKIRDRREAGPKKDNTCSHMMKQLWKYGMLSRLFGCLFIQHFRDRSLTRASVRIISYCGSCETRRLTRNTASFVNAESRGLRVRKVAILVVLVAVYGLGMTIYASSTMQDSGTRVPVLVCSSFTLFVFLFYDSLAYVVLSSCSAVLAQYLRVELVALGSCRTPRHVEQVRLRLSLIKKLKRSLNGIWHPALAVWAACLILVLCVALFAIFDGDIGQPEVWLALAYSAYASMSFADVAISSQCLSDLARQLKDASLHVETSGESYKEQVDPEALCLTGGGFFRLNKALLVSMSGSIITYAVILVQTSDELAEHVDVSRLV
ncbi:hypothetical protein MTO96_019035 [Rhipicephalus appendiculatus]